MNIVKNIKEIERLYFDEVKEHENTKSVNLHLINKYECLQELCTELIELHMNNNEDYKKSIKKIKDFLDT